MHTILIADDDKNARNIVRGLIRESGYELDIFEAVNGEDAFELVEQFKPDILFSDITMPYMTGLELAKKVKEVDKDIIIVFVSGHYEFQYAVDALRLGVLDYISKPIDPQSFYNALTKAMSQLDYANDVSWQNEAPHQDEGETKISVDNGRSPRRDVEKVRTYISNHYSEPLSVEQLASKVFLSTGYMSYIFKKETGEGISQFISTCRMEKAKKLLMETNMKVVQISREVGYSNAAYFCKAFKECFGCSPEQYRKGLVEYEKNA
jgi:YesN/AraC family two-component response regulator